MAGNSKIEWTETTWNPVTGCDKISAGCKNCYAERMAIRLKAMNVPRYKNGFSLTLHEDVIDLPRQWKHPRLIFVNSMSDLFHERVPLAFIEAVFEVMNDCPQHTFQILTKRSRRLREVSDKLSWAPNIWMGVSIENKQVIERIEDLKQTAAIVRFLSCEPLIGPLDQLPLDTIHWVIVGGESGPRARPMEKSWVIGIRDQCQRSGVAFFFKQWGGVHKSLSGRLLDGRTYDEMPTTTFTLNNNAIISELISGGQYG